MKLSEGRTLSPKMLVSAEKPMNPPPVDRAGEMLEVERIMNGKKIVHLLHRGEVYRLQVTRQGKLLLTK